MFKGFGGVKMRRANIFISVLCVFSVVANAAEVPIKEGMSFLTARKALIRAGWQPSPTALGDFGVENAIKRKGFVEIESCTVGVQFCSFHYTQKERCLRLATVGEEIKQMKVYSWYFDCSEVD